MTDHWLVATTKPHRDGYAHEQCAALGFETYAPRIMRKLKGTPHRFVAQPLFPSYLFVRFRDDWPKLMSTFGIGGVLRYGEKPQLLHDRYLAPLRAREENGFVILPKPQPGQRVRIIRGAFDGHCGLYQGMASHDRIRILLEVLGRRLPVFVAADAVSIAA